VSIKRFDNGGEHRRIDARISLHDAAIAERNLNASTGTCVRRDADRHERRRRGRSTHSSWQAAILIAAVLILSRSAVSATEPPGPNASSSTAAFSAAVNRRRTPSPLIPTRIASPRTTISGRKTHPPQDPAQ